MSTWAKIRFKNNLVQLFRVDSLFSEIITLYTVHFQILNLAGCFHSLRAVYTLHASSFSKIHNRGTLNDNELCSPAPLEEVGRQRNITKRYTHFFWRGSWATNSWYRSILQDQLFSKTCFVLTLVCKAVRCKMIRADIDAFRKIGGRFPFKSKRKPLRLYRLRCGE